MEEEEEEEEEEEKVYCRDSWKTCLVMFMNTPLLFIQFCKSDTVDTENSGEFSTHREPF